jgi:hypothetical protein
MREVEAGLVIEDDEDDEVEEAEGDGVEFDMTEVMVTATVTESRCYRHLQRKVTFKVTYGDCIN